MGIVDCHAWLPQDTLSFGIFTIFYDEETNHWIWGYLSGKPKWLGLQISLLLKFQPLFVAALSSPLPKVKERRDLVFTLAERGGIALSQRYILLCFPLQYAFEMLRWFWWIALEVNLGFDTLWWNVMEADCGQSSFRLSHKHLWPLPLISPRWFALARMEKRVRSRRMET